MSNRMKYEGKFQNDEMWCSICCFVHCPLHYTSSIIMDIFKNICRIHEMLPALIPKYFKIYILHVIYETKEK